MLKTVTTRLLLLALCASSWAFAQTPSPYPFSEGYYKEMFINRGPGINSSDTKLHAENLGWRYDRLWLGNDEEKRNRFFDLVAGRDEDRNGILLFPDGSPRYRIMTVGGADSDHTGFIGGIQGPLMERNHPFLNHEAGNFVLKEFIAGGAGYAGFCAGMQLLDDFGLVPQNIDPYSYPTPPGGELSEFYGQYTHFNTGIVLPSVKQAGGTWVFQEHLYDGLQRVADITVDWDELGTLTFGASWVYINPLVPDAGTVFMSGVHPEMGGDSGSVNYVSDELKRTIARNHDPVLKKDLVNGIDHEAYDETFAGDWEKTKIGDGQYHHYRVTLPSGQKYLRVELIGETDFDYHLFLHKGDYAFDSYYTKHDTTTGFSKTLTFDDPGPGEWYISVKGASFPDSDYLTSDTNIGMLNGMGYTLTATWSDQPAPQECETAVSDVLVIGNNTCRGQDLDYQFNGTACGAGQNVALALVDGAENVYAEYGARTIAENTNSGSFTTPPRLPQTQYRLRLTESNGTRTYSNWVTIRTMPLLSASTSAQAVLPGQSVSVNWESNCSFTGFSVVALRDQSGTEISRTVTTNSVFGANQLDYQVNAAPGSYYFTVYAGWVAINTDPFEVLQPNLDRVWTDANAIVLNEPFTVNWEAEGGFFGQNAVLSVFASNGLSLKTLSSTVAVQNGVGGADFTLTADDLNVGFSVNSVYFRLSVGGQSVASTYVPVSDQLAEWDMNVPAHLYRGQVLSLRYRQHVALAGDRLILQYVNDAGTVVSSQTLNVNQEAGEKEAVTAIFLPVQSEQLHFRLEDVNGTVLLTSTKFDIREASLAFNNQLDKGVFTWQWEGEDSVLRITIYDNQTNQKIYQSDQNQQTGNHELVAPSSSLFTKGREYRLAAGVIGRLTPIGHLETFTY